MKLWISFLFNLSFWLFFSSIGNSAEYHLYDSQGQQVEKYSKIIKKLQPGDTLVFSNGTITLGEYLGEGLTTKIFSIGGGKAIRLPLRSGDFKYRNQRPIPYIDFLYFYVLGYRKLVRSEIPIPKIFFKESLEGQFLIVEEMDVKHSLYDLAKHLTQKQLRALFIFAKATAPYTEIYDFGPEQIGWDKTNKRWVLLDFTEGADRAIAPYDLTVFDTYKWKYFPTDIKKQLKETIYRKRLHREKKRVARQCQNSFEEI